MASFFFLNLLAIKQLLLPTSRPLLMGLTRTGHTPVMDPSAILCVFKFAKVGEEGPSEALKAPGLRRAWIFCCAKGFFPMCLQSACVLTSHACLHMTATFCLQSACFFTCLPSHDCCFCLLGFRLFCLLSLQLAEKTSPIQIPRLRHFKIVSLAMEKNKNKSITRPNKTISSSAQSLGSPEFLVFQQAGERL